MSGDESRGTGRGKPPPAKPTPVRALDDASSRGEGEPDVPPETVLLQVDPDVWVVEAMGQAEGAGGVSILLVRFTRQGEAPDALDRQPASPTQTSGGSLEAWLVGASLTDVPEPCFIAALARAEPWKGSVRDAPFFVEEGGRRGR